MRLLPELYRDSLALLTDLYQLTMAQGYWKLGRLEQEATFHLTFRHNPFEGGYAVAAGLASAIEYIETFSFHESDLAVLAGLNGNDHRPLFDQDFLQYLSSLRLACDIDAIPEGTVVFANEPLLRVSGSILDAQLLETALLNLVNFQTLVATKAARLCQAARGDQVIEFGLRRAQGIDGGLSAARAAYIGGVHATSNVLAAKLLDIPVGGTHAHSWVMSFDSELEAFEGYARASPNNCVFLVDTYNTIEGIHHAVEVGKQLRQQGHKLIGVRLDSGDLAYLSIQARRTLDENGFADAHILASNDLDEHIIASLKDQGAKIDTWGVGTRLATAYDQPALGGVYKLAAVRWPGQVWQPKVKLSEQSAKVTTPGILQVRRYFRDGEAAGDMIYDLESPPSEEAAMIDPQDFSRRKQFAASARHEDLLVPIFRQGRRVYDSPSLPQIRQRTASQLAQFHPGVKRFINPHQHPVGLEQSLHDVRARMILQLRQSKIAAK